jgi:hypothetical protein
MAWRDAIFIGGGALMVYGIWCIHPPSAFIFAGASVSTIAYLTTPIEVEPEKENDEPSQ